MTVSQADIRAHDKQQVESLLNSVINGSIGVNIVPPYEFDVARNLGVDSSLIQKANDINEQIKNAFAFGTKNQSQSNADATFRQIHPDLTTAGTPIQARQETTVQTPIVTPVVEIPPVQARQQTTVQTPIVTPVVEIPPVQARTTPIVSSPGSSLPKIAVIAVAVFGFGLLFFSPRASKRK